MGPNGSGKSTLAHALMGRPGTEVTAGSITHGRAGADRAAGLAAGAVPGCSSRCSTRSRCPASACTSLLAAAAEAGRGRRRASLGRPHGRRGQGGRPRRRAPQPRPQRRPLGRRAQAHRDGAARRAAPGHLHPRRGRLGPRRRRAGRGGAPAAARHDRVGRRASSPSRTSTASWCSSRPTWCTSWWTGASLRRAMQPWRCSSSRPATPATRRIRNRPAAPRDAPRATRHSARLPQFRGGAWYRGPSWRTVVRRATGRVAPPAGRRGKSANQEGLAALGRQMRGGPGTEEAWPTSRGCGRSARASTPPTEARPRRAGAPQRQAEVERGQEDGGGARSA